MWKELNLKEIRFLFLLYIYPPYFGTAPVRNFNISKYLAKLGSKNVLFTTTNREISKEAMNELNGLIEFHKLPTLDYRTRFFKKYKNEHYKESVKNNPLVQFLIKLLNSFPLNIFFSEGGILYIISGIISGNKKIKEFKITHLYSSYRPLADHYIAFFLKKIHPELIWVADFRDLIIEPFYQQLLLPGLHQKLYRAIFKNANLLITISAGMARHLKYYNKKVVVVKNGFDFKSIDDKIPAELFSITYTGSMFLDKRDPKPLFLALCKLINEGKIKKEHLIIHYAGKDSWVWVRECQKYNLSDNLRDHGLQSIEYSRQLQNASNINLLLSVASSDFDGILTGKLIEYLEAGSPVIAINVGEVDKEIDHVLKSANVGFCVSESPVYAHMIENFVQSEYIIWKKNKLVRKPVNVDILKENYSFKATMSELVSNL